MFDKEQARIHTGLHRFMEIGQIFMNDSKKIGEHAPISPLEPCAFSARCFGNRSPFLLDPRLRRKLSNDLHKKESANNNAR